MIMSDMLSMGADTLRENGIEESGLDAWYLLSYCLGITKSQYYMNINDDVASEKVNGYRELIGRRAGHIPLQYITGSQEFMGIDFKVNESVLIPRQDTEVLAELAVRHAAGKRVLDMCTGSGCIAVSIAKLAGQSRVTAADISKEALVVAGENARLNNAEVTFIESDLWDNVHGVYDIIVSNPPYITDAEMLTLMPEVGRHEPRLALYGGMDGLDYYSRIIAGAGVHLAADGIIMFEIGCRQAGSVSGLLEAYGYRDIRVEKDFAGFDRVVWGVMPG